MTSGYAIGAFAVTPGDHEVERGPTRPRPGAGGVGRLIEPALQSIRLNGRADAGSGLPFELLHPPRGRQRPPLGVVGQVVVADPDAVANAVAVAY